MDFPKGNLPTFTVLVFRPTRLISMADHISVWNPKKSISHKRVSFQESNKVIRNVKHYPSDGKSHDSINKVFSVGEDSIFKNITHKRVDTQIQTNILNKLPSEVKSHFNTIRLDFSPTNEDYENLDKCSSILKQLSKAFNVNEDLKQVLPKETALSTLGDPNKEINERIDAKVNIDTEYLNTKTNIDKNIKADKTFDKNNVYVELLSKGHNTATLPKPCYSRTHQLSTSSQFDPVVGSKVFSSLNALELCTQLEEWDRQHPKSMDPPGRVPNLTHAILQRKRQER